MLAALCAALGGCDSAPVPGERNVVADDAPAATDKAAEAPAADKGRPALPNPHGVKAQGGKAQGGKAQMELQGDVAWKTWDEGKAEATRDGKPIMLLVFAHWCPKCRALGPVFADPEIEELSKRFVMVKQDGDERPEWLTRLNAQYGGYVPRVFFMDSDGTVREDVQSPHPKYPYFYAAQQVDALKASMKKAAGS